MRRSYALATRVIGALALLSSLMHMPYFFGMHSIWSWSSDLRSLLLSQEGLVLRQAKGRRLPAKQSHNQGPEATGETKPQPRAGGYRRNKATTKGWRLPAKQSHKQDPLPPVN